jgi:hypothetical protein
MSSARVIVFVPDVPEFSAVVEFARALPSATVTPHDGVYWRIENDAAIELSRTHLGLKPAIWYGCLTGGVIGRITRFDRDVVRIEPDESWIEGAQGR